MPTEELRDSNKLYNPTTIGELMKKYPFIDWLPYINSKVYGISFTEADRVIIQQPSYFDQLEDVLKLINKRTVANYIMWRELADYIPFLTSDLLDKAFEFIKSLTGRLSRQPRWSDCVRGVSGMLSVAVSSMYVREHFNDEKKIKSDIGQIVSEIKIEFEKLLIANDWMDKETKEEALKKLKSMNSNVAYPSQLMNDSMIEDYYKDLELNATNYLQSAINIDLHGKKFVCLRYLQQASRNDWIDQSTTTSVNANYNGKTNSIRKFFYERMNFKLIFFCNFRN
jgi:predicted metalloendopeptidase